MSPSYEVNIISHFLEGGPLPVPSGCFPRSVDRCMCLSGAAELLIWARRVCTLPVPAEVQLHACAPALTSLPALCKQCSDELSWLLPGNWRAPTGVCLVCPRTDRCTRTHSRASFPALLMPRPYHYPFSKKEPRPQPAQPPLKWTQTCPGIHQNISLLHNISTYVVYEIFFHKLYAVNYECLAMENNYFYIDRGKGLNNIKAIFHILNVFFFSEQSE